MPDLRFHCRRLKKSTPDGGATVTLPKEMLVEIGWTTDDWLKISLGKESIILERVA